MLGNSLSFSMVVLYSRDRYEIIELLKISISHYIKQPCSSVHLKKALEMMYKQCSTFVKQD